MPPPDNRLTFQKLEIFCAVVQYGGVGKAAAELYLTQPVVSAHLKTFQERMGADLLVRDGRGVRLTEAGQSVHRWAREVLRRREDLVQELGDLTSGTAGSVRIGAGMSVGNYLLPELLVDFRLTHPRARISLQNSNVESALEGVRTGQLDYAFVASYQTLDADLFETQLVGRPRYALVASASNRTIPERVNVKQLAELEFISPPSGMRIRSSQDFALSTIGVSDRKVVMELGSAESIKYAVARDLGVSMLWRTSMERELADGTLREVVIEGAELQDNLYAVQSRSTILTPLQENLKTVLMTRVAERLRFTDDEV